MSFFLDNKLVSYGNEKRFDIDRDYVKRKSRHKIKNTLKDIVFQKNLKTHISLNKYSVQKEQGYDLTLVNLDDDLITNRIDAKKIKWNSKEEKWSLNNYSIRYFDEKEKRMRFTLKIKILNQFRFSTQGHIPASKKTR